MRCNFSLEEWFFISSLLYILVAILVPIPYYLIQVWPTRRKQFLSRFNHRAFTYYIKAFYPAEIHLCDQPSWENILLDKYNQIQEKTYVLISYLVFLVLVAVSMIWVIVTVGQDMGLWKSPIYLRPLALYALLGGLLWVTFDQGRKCMNGVFSPHDVQGFILRLIICIPVGYALTPLLEPSAGYMFAFILGVLPTTEIVNLLRKRLGPAVASGETRNELLIIPGITSLDADRLQSVNINSILELAYIDPVEISIKTGIEFLFILDCKSQALLFVYVEPEQIPVFKKFGLRGAQEIKSLVFNLDHGDQHPHDCANSVITALASDLKFNDPDCIKSMLRTISLDPHTAFLDAIWYSYAGDEKKKPDEKEKTTSL